MKKLTLILLMTTMVMSTVCTSVFAATITDNGTWYYLNTYGSMESNTVIDGYTLGSDGAWIN